MNNYAYHLGGCLPINAPSYVKRQADEELYQTIKAGEFCYVLNSRQMGKSSLRVRTTQILQAEGIICTTIDIAEIGTFEINPSQWYAGIIDSIVGNLKLNHHFDINNWWATHNKLSHVHKFSKFIDYFLLNQIAEKIVIFLDEVDSIFSLPFSVDDFFAVIREFYNKRAEQEKYERITFVMLGVATPSDLILDKRRTPFNIGKAIELTGFKLDEVQPLTLGLMGKVNDYEAIMSAILDWTGGQPFLTQKVCRLILKSATNNFHNYSPANFVEKLVRQKIIENWQLYDQP